MPHQTQFSRITMHQIIMVISLMAVSVSGDRYRQVCFFTESSTVRVAGQPFSPQDVDPSLCTHLVYAYGHVSDLQLDLSPPPPTAQRYRQLNALKRQNPDLKTLIAVGGWNFRSGRLSAILSTSATRGQFVRSALSVFRQYGFDGIDLHFVHPATRRASQGHKAKFMQLCQEMRHALDTIEEETGSRYLLAISGPAEKKYIDRGYDVGNISRLADFINLMTFDFHGGWEDRTGHQSALFAGKRDNPREAQRNVEWAVDYWIQNGSPPSKLVVGMALYGRGFTLMDPDEAGVGAPAMGPSLPGPFTGQGGLLAFSEVCQMMRGGATRHWLRGQQVPYLTRGNQWIGCEDRTSLTMKVRWLKEKKLGGWMAWSVDYDDVTGEGCQLGRYPLLTAMANALDDSSSVITEPPTIPTEAPSEDDLFNEEEFCVDRPDGRYPYPGNCRLYVECVWEAGQVRKCLPGLTYDIERERCTQDMFALGCFGK